jgi:hypothetical protein
MPPEFSNRMKSNFYAIKFNSANTMSNNIIPIRHQPTVKKTDTRTGHQRQLQPWHTTATHLGMKNGLARDPHRSARVQYNRCPGG